MTIKLTLKPIHFKLIPANEKSPHQTGLHINQSSNQMKVKVISSESNSYKMTIWQAFNA
jgi:hypothetical protein